MSRVDEQGQRRLLPSAVSRQNKNPPDLSLHIREHAGKDFHEGGQAGGAPEAAAHQGAHPDVSRCDVFQRTHQPQSGRSRRRLQMALRQPPICSGLRSPRGGAAPARSSGRGCRVRPVRVLVTRCSLVMGRGAGRTAAVLVHRQCVGRVLPVGSLCRLLHVLCLCVQLEGFSVGEEDCGMMGGNCGQRLFSTRPTRVSAVSH